MATEKDSLGQDTIYICQSCRNREKEYALKDRHSKYCTKCGGFSVKSYLVESYNYLTSNITPPPYYNISDGEDFDENDF